MIQIIVDRLNLSGTIDLIGEYGRRFDSEEGKHVLDTRPLHPSLQMNRELPEDTSLCSVLKNRSGGTWGGCVYDVDKILERLGENYVADKA